MVVTKKTLANLAKLFLNQAKFKKSFQISKYKEAEKMKLTFKHTALSLALAGSFALTGCNFIGDGDAVFTDPDQPGANQIALSGSANKGALLGADVYACVFKSACAAADANTIEGSVGYLGKTVTNAPDGTYNLAVEESAEDKIVVVRVMANSNTTMDCDLSDGCAGIDLTGIELKTVTAVEDGDTSIDTVEVSVFSTLATEILEAEADNAVTTDNFAVKATIASKGVAATLGLGVSADQTDSLNFFSMKVPTAKSDNTGFTGADEFTKNAALVNASFGKLANTTKTIATAIKEVGAIVKKSVTQPTSIDANDVTIMKNLATVVKNEVAANVTKIGNANVTVPVTKDPEDVTEESLKEIGEQIRQELEEVPDNTGTGTGTGSGSSSGGQN